MSAVIIDLHRISMQESLSVVILKKMHRIFYYYFFIYSRCIFTQCYFFWSFYRRYNTAWCNVSRPVYVQSIKNLLTWQIQSELKYQRYSCNNDIATPTHEKLMESEQGFTHKILVMFPEHTKKEPTKKIISHPDCGAHISHLRTIKNTDDMKRNESGLDRILYAICFNQTNLCARWSDCKWLQAEIFGNLLGNVTERCNANIHYNSRLIFVVSIQMD